MTSQAPTRIADYDVVEPLRRPGAETYVLARPPARLGLLADKVVVKIVEGRHEQERFERLAEELRHFASIRSPYLVTLYDAGSEDGRLWYSMEYHALGTLAEPTTPLTTQQKLTAVADAARGAHALHEAGIAHRDIRPANILLGPAHGVLADLELSRLLAAGRTVTSTAPVGDLEYTDPSLVRGEKASRASDIWALGLTLHKAIAETSAFPGLNPEAGMLPAVRRILTGGPEISTKLEPRMAELVRACVAPDPSDRPATALALAEEIEAL
jgi:serine/threonine protein kinase